MKLHENAELFREAIIAAAQSIGIREIYVEKDYWVTYALYIIFHSDMKDYAVFKGGTSLSKCYNIINRFSEDIDIVVFRGDNVTSSQLDKRVRRISKVVEGSILEEVHIEGISRRRGNFRKIAYKYSKSDFNQEFGEVGDKIVVEVSRLGNFEPCSELYVNTYIADMMMEKGQNELVE